MRIVVIGGGASGVVCAIHAKREDNEVIILEKNEKLLKKLLLTGNGRCNYMHDAYQIEDYHSQNPEYIEDFICDKNIEDVRYFFDSIGIVSKNRNGYIYPFSNQATTVRDALVREVKRKKIEVIYNASLKSIGKKNNQFLLHMEDRDLYCDKVVVSTGSYAYPRTGSDGFGYSLLEKMGHTIIKPLPALVQLVSSFPYCDEWNGVRCDVRLVLEEDGEDVAIEEGEAQFTDYGISGICTFNLSHFVSRGLDVSKKEILKINFVPFVDTLITPWMDRYSKKNLDKNVFDLLEGFLNKKMIPIILNCCHLRSDVFYEDLTSDEKLTLCKYLSSFPIEIVGTKDFENCQVCNGGVSLREIKLDTMESKIVDGLYIVGELLDINGNCGGFNLTECWISGMLAGRSLGDLSDKSSSD